MSRDTEEDRVERSEEIEVSGKEKKHSDVGGRSGVEWKKRWGDSEVLE